MKKNIRIFLPVFLMSVLLAACVSATSTASPAQSEAIEPTFTLSPVVETAAQPASSPTGTVAPTAFPAATSRGPDLHATDPSSVSLASGGLQLVEFFRFT